MTVCLKIKNIDCPNCAAKIEKAVGKLGGVESCSLNYIAERMELELSEHIDELKSSIAKACRKAEPDCEIEFPE